MRAAAKRRLVEDDEESAFVSMTDLTVSFLFIVMILLAFFASQMQARDTVPRTDFERVVGERDTAQRKLKEREDELLAALAKIAALQKTVDQQTNEIDQLRQQKRDLEERNEQFVQELTRFKEQVVALQNRIGELEKANAELERRINELEEQLRRLQKADPLEVYLSQVTAERRKILEQLRDSLRSDFPELRVDVSEQMDALRFRGDGLFQSGSDVLAADKRRYVEALAFKLEELLPCYTLGQGSTWKPDCNGAGAVIEAVQIEGHTDADGDDNTNLTLSTARANQTFFAMIRRVPTLIQHLNSLNQPVLSVAGYGEMRPVAGNTTPEGKATNRRIDLRIIMYTPKNEEDIARIREELRRGIIGESRNDPQ